MNVSVSVSDDALLSTTRHHSAYDIVMPYHNDIDKLRTEHFYYDFKNCDFAAINDCLHLIDWEKLFFGKDVNSVVEAFYAVLYDVIDQFVPVKRYKSNNFPAWFSGELRDLIVKKKIAHRKYKESGSVKCYEEFSYLRERCKALQATCYAVYLDNIERNLLTDPRFFWRHISNARNTNSYPSSMVLDDQRADDGDSIVNLFAKQFSGIYTKKDVQIPSFVPRKTLNVSTLGVSLGDVFDGISNLKLSNSAGPDGIPSTFVKHCLYSLSVPLHFIFSLSLREGNFPNYWKISYLTPIFKSGNRNDIRNYRGVAKSSVMPKLFDRLVSDQLNWACREMITNDQHGFLFGRSTITNVLTYEQFLLEGFERRVWIDCIYTDFSKAFDRVNHKLLLHKLRVLGFGELIVEWISSFLTGRSQYVRINDCISGEISVFSGVPQGSHCGPALFILFVNDITDCLVGSYGLLFADDLKLYKCIESESDVSGLQSDLDSLFSWTELNDLTLNVEKCFSVSFGRSGNKIESSYFLNGAPLKSVSEVRDLGVIFDSQLTFKSHINKIVREAFKKLGFISRYGRDLSAHSFKLLYCSLVRSGLEYASVVWSPHYRYQIKAIESVQRRFLRILAFKANVQIRNDTDYSIDYSTVMTEYNLDLLSQRRMRADVLFIFKLLNGYVSAPDLLQRISFNTVHRTRNSNMFKVSFHSTDYCYYGPISRMVRCLNSNGIDPFGSNLSRFRRQLHRFIYIN